MKKVRVWLPFRWSVPYTVEVENIDVESVIKAMLNKDPSDWDYDPEFYENLGFNFREFIKHITEEDIEEVK